MTERTSWQEAKKPRSDAAQRAYDDEGRISAFRELVYRLRTEAGLTQAELAGRMSTTQSAIARMEGGGTRPTLETLEKLAFGGMKGPRVRANSAPAQRQSSPRSITRGARASA